MIDLCQKPFPLLIFPAKDLILIFNMGSDLIWRIWTL